MWPKRTLVVAIFAATIMLSLTPFIASAGERVLSNNKGDTSAVWYITGEQTLVMNGFDLTPLGLRFPATIDKVSIAVDTPVSGAVVDVVVYQDANGGSPIDATLAGQTQVTIAATGVYTVTFPTPVSITQPVLWVGFYLPVGFKFQADKPGTSVLTYWAWTSGGRFDLSKLSTATVLGPSNGSAPVSFDMKGIARITAEISNSAGAGTPVPTLNPAVTPIPGLTITQVPVTSTQPMNVLKVYPPACDTLFWDTEDVGITFSGSIAVRCTAIWPGYAPAAPLGYARRQMYYDITFYNSKGEPLSEPLPAPVTHCILANPADINSAVIGLATGSPRRFTVLPTIRINDLICAEIGQSGGISYFVPG